MKDNLLKQEEIKAFYEFVANRVEGAFEFLSLWATYCHQFDDLIDEGCNVVQLIECNNNFLRLTTCQFFENYKPALICQIYLAAEAYRASEQEEKDTSLGEHLSHEGNNMIRCVALITGGYKHMEDVSRMGRELTKKEHPTTVGEFNVDIVNLNNLPQKD